MTMMIRVLACGLALLAVSWLWPADRGVRAAGPATIEGQVSNGTNGAAVPAGQRVVLHVLGPDRIIDERSTTTDAFGHFRFVEVEVAGATDGIVEVEYQGASYFGDRVDLNAGSVGPVRIEVFEATPSDEILAVERRALFFGQFDGDTRTVAVLEMYTFANRSDRTFVPPAPSASDATIPAGLLRFSLPAGASDVTPLMDLARVPVFQVDMGFAAALPIQPGRHEVAFSYRFPYSGSSSGFGTSVRHPTADVRILLPEPGPRISGEGIEALETTTMGDQRYRVYRAGSLASGARLTFVLTDLPTGGWLIGLREPRTLRMAAVGLGILALFGVAVYAWRRSGQEAEEVAGSRSWSQEEQALLLSLARLDDRRAGGELDDGTYRHLREERKQELLARLEASGGTGSEH